MMSLYKIKPLLSININKTLSRTVAVNSSNTTTKLQPTGTLKPWKQIPGPPSYPIFGVMLNFVPIIGSFGPIEDISILSSLLYKKYGPIVQFTGGLGSPPTIFLYDLDSIEEVLRSEDSRMPERPGFPWLEYYRKQMEYAGESSGLLVEHGERWKSFRSAVNPVMMQPKTVKLYSDELDKVSIDMVERLRSIRDEKNMIKEDFEIEMNKWALESIAVVALGGRVGCIDGDLPEGSPARQLIQSVREIFEISDKLDNRPSLWRYIKTPYFNKAMKIYDDHLRLTKIFITKARENYKQRDTATENKGILEKLLEVDENVAVVMASDMLFAGVDTTAHTMIGILYLLGSNQDKQSELRKEIMSTTSNDRRPYLKGCIKESLRLLPIFVANLRRATKDYNLLGYSIPKGECQSPSGEEIMKFGKKQCLIAQVKGKYENRKFVVTQMHLICMHETLSKLETQYPRANEFLPERWVTKKEDDLHYGHAHPFANSPFGFGVRMCIGRRIAELELETFVARLIENFEVEWFGPPPKRKTSSLSYITGPYNFVFRDVNKIK